VKPVEQERGEREHGKPLTAAPAAPVDARVAMASALGNQAFGALVAGVAEHAPAGRGLAGRGLAGAADIATSAQLARAVVARNETEAGGSTATATAPAQSGSTWVAPLDFGSASDKQAARFPLLRMREEAQKLKVAGFNEFDIVLDEIQTWLSNFEERGTLSAAEVEKLRWFGSDFKDKYDAAIRQIAEALVGQLTQWISEKPINESVVFDLKEELHKKFISSEDPDVLAKSSALLGTVEDFIGKFTDITEHAGKVKDHVKAAKKLDDIHEGLDGIKEKAGEIKEYIDLARNIGKMTGQLGTTPAGVDALGAFDATLDVMNFVITKAGVPGITQLWEGYIYKVSKICVNLLRGIYDAEEAEDRGPIKYFFDNHRGDAAAPSIQKLLRGEGNIGGLHPGFMDHHFPGGQPMLDFMWKLMRDEAISVPGEVEDYFVKWKEEVGAGAGEKDQIETDSAWTNAWNLVTRERATNLLPWLKKHKDDAWVKLYGGIQPPG
jgi:hypothetical protein